MSHRDFMQRPGPTSSPVRCTILRDLTSCKGQPIYSLYLDDPAKFILAAQRQKRSKASFYAVSLDNQVLLSLLSLRIIALWQEAVSSCSIRYALRRLEGNISCFYDIKQSFDAPVWRAGLHSARTGIMWDCEVKLLGHTILSLQ